jgi:hypothetical protein
MGISRWGEKDDNQGIEEKPDGQDQERGRHGNLAE